MPSFSLKVVIIICVVNINAIIVVRDLFFEKGTQRQVSVAK